MHQRHQILARIGAGYTLANTDAALNSEVALPDTTAGRDTAYEVKNRLLRGKSMEFRSLKDRVEDGVRIISDAIYYGEGIVDLPAYRGSFAQMRSWDEYLQAVEYRDAHSGLYLPRGASATLERRAERRGENLGDLLRRLRDEQDVTNDQLGGSRGDLRIHRGGHTQRDH